MELIKTVNYITIVVVILSSDVPNEGGNTTRVCIHIVKYTYVIIILTVIIS